MSRSPRRLALRPRITLVVSAVFVVAASVLSFTLVELLRSQLTGNLDSTNERRARDIAALVDDEALAESDEKEIKLPPPRGETDVIQVVGPTGVIASSGGAPNEAAFTPPVGSSRPVTADRVVAGRSVPYRFSSAVAQGKKGARFTIVVGASLEPVNDTIGAVALGLIVGVPVLAVLVGALTWLAVGRSLRPVDDIRREFSRITTTDLHRRVPHPGTADELGALADTLNQTLERLELDVATQQRFVADAAHELRSPLAALSAQLEIVRADPDVDDVRTTIATLLDQSRRLEDLVDDLLVLARLDAAPRPTARQRLIDVDELVLEEAMRARLTSPVPIDTTAVSSAQVRATGDNVQRIVRNLVDNAVRHARSTVRLELREQDGWAALTVDDDGSGVAASDRDRIFERFARLDEARDRRTGGSGLGLAISAELAALHGGAIRVADCPTGGARFRLFLPAALPDLSSDLNASSVAFSAPTGRDPQADRAP